jgi:hypothetical protein
MNDHLMQDSARYSRRHLVERAILWVFALCDESRIAAEAPGGVLPLQPRASIMAVAKLTAEFRPYVEQAMVNNCLCRNNPTLVF